MIYKQFYTFINSHWRSKTLCLMCYFRSVVWFIALVFIFNQNTSCQPWLYDYYNLKSAGTTLSFNEQQQAFNNYFKEESSKKGYKQFRRWENFMEPRLGDNQLLDSKAYWQALQNHEDSESLDTLQWIYVGPPDTPPVKSSDDKSGNGRLNCVAFHPTNPNIIYVGAPSGGLWISYDYGSSWLTTTDKLNAIGISDIVVREKDGETEIFAATGDGDGGDAYAIGIIKSIDGGLTWIPTALSLSASNESFFRRIIMNPDNTNIMLATSSKGIYKTTDAWETFTLVETGNFRDLEMKPGSPETIYATSFDYAGNAQIFRSTDYGNSFTATTSGLNISGKVNRIEIAVTPANNDYIYALCSSAQTSGFYALYRSTNSGVSWSLMYDDSRENLLGHSPSGNDIGGLGHYAIAMTISPIDHNHFVVGGINLWLTTNGGTKWDLTSFFYHSPDYEYVHADQHHLVYSPHDNALYAANDGGIYRSDNDGATWEDISNNLQILQTYRLGSAASVSNSFVCGNQDNGTFLFDGSSWQMIQYGDGMHCYIDSEDENIIYTSAFEGSLYKSLNKGQEFQSIKPDFDIYGAWITPFIMHPQKSNTIYSAYQDIYQSNDGGNSWEKISENLSAENLRSLAIAPSNDNYLYTATYDQLYKTTDGGISWNEINTAFTDLAITSICISPNDPNKVWISLSGYNETDKVFFSANGGESWINYSNGLPNTPINDIVMRYNSNNELYAATDIGVYYRHADTSAWINCSQTLPNAIVSDIEIIESLDKIRIATYGRGIWEATLPQPIPSKADFFANITTGCFNAPIELYYTNTLAFDSLLWSTPSAIVLSKSSNNDTLVISYNNQGRYTIQLQHYRNDTVINEIKYEYIEIRDTLDIVLSPEEYFVCDSAIVDIELKKGYEYSWMPHDFLDTTKGNAVRITYPQSIEYDIEASHGVCRTELNLPIILLPDKICKATYLSTGTKNNFVNFCAGTQENEPVPPVGSGDNNGCISDDGWCLEQNKLENTLWFKVVVPDNGYLRIEVEGFDTQIALYKAETCHDLLSGFYELVAANDDKSLVNSDSRIIVDSGLVPGDTLYLQVDGSFDGATGEFSITISEESVSTKIPKSEEDSFIYLYPNPAKDIVTLQIFNSNGKNTVIELFDFSGRRVYYEKLIPNSNRYKKEINTSLLRGIYLVKVQSVNQQTIQRLLVL